MNQLLLPLLLLLSVATAHGDGLPPYSRDYSPRRDPFADGRAAIALATESNRRVLIEVGGEWCVWCHVLDRLIREHAELEATLRRDYVVLKVNVSEENDNAEFMAGMPVLAGYPKLFVARSDGSVIHAQDPSEFFVNGSYSAELLLVFLRRWADKP